MSRGVNKVILIGNLGRDPDVRYLPSGAAVSNVALATQEQWKDKTSGERQERTEWHRVVFFGRLAEIVGEYLKKGSHIYVEGSLRTKKWQDKEGKDRYTIEVVASEMQMLGGRGQSEDKPHQKPGENVPAHEYESGGGDDFSDDIPFNRLRNEYLY